MTRSMTLAMLLAGTTALPAAAATLVSDRAAFVALGVGFSYADNFADRAIDAPFSVSTTGTGNIVFYPGATSFFYAPGTSVNGSAYLQIQLRKTADPAVTVTFSSTTPFQSLGFDLKPLGAAPSPTNDYGEGVIFTASNGETGQFFTPATPAPTGTSAFQGFVFDAPVTSLTFTTVGAGALPGAQGTDNITAFGTDNLIAYNRVVTAAAAAPEPGAWVMLIAGFGLVGGALRRRRRTVATA